MKQNQLTFEVANIETRQDLGERHRPDVSVIDLKMRVLCTQRRGPQQSSCSTAQAGRLQHPLPAPPEMISTPNQSPRLWPAHGQ